MAATVARLLGKDPSKVTVRPPTRYALGRQEHRSPGGLASRAEVQVAYAIGKAEPVGLSWSNLRH
ncbi:hypothetical protein GCM10020229_27480 [Kitasatospora albolonga]|uniref:hypothetical protein n=1 Tax=Kitasatospora albolonga TaxID=68173 RepID=UPI00336E6DFD